MKRNTDNRPDDKPLMPAKWAPDDMIISLPFIGMHLIALVGVFCVGFSWTAAAVCVFMYFIRMFGVTAGYHRYFSHRTYQMGRRMQFAMACLATSSTEMGPLWWASHHRQHHMYSDTENDVHSPITRSFFWSHVGWFLARKNTHSISHLVRDLEKFPELVWLNQWHMVPAFVLGIFLVITGTVLEKWAPGLSTNGVQLLVWGFFISTVFLVHGTSTINSFSHLYGSRRYNTSDSSRNNWLLAIITLGEGWHNNHHRYPASERQGFFWWEYDISHYILVTLSWFGLVWDMKAPSKDILDEASFYNPLTPSRNPQDLLALGLKEAAAAPAGSGQ